MLWDALLPQALLPYTKYILPSRYSFTPTQQNTACASGKEDFNYTERRIRILKELMQQDNAIRNWDRITSIGTRYLENHVFTCLEQQLCRCIDHYELSTLFFPLVWTFMKPWNILRHYKSLFKSIRVIKTYTNHDVSKHQFLVDNVDMQGYILCLIIPMKKDFQCVFLTYTKDGITLHAVLSRSNIIYRDGTKHVWQHKSPNHLSIADNHKPIGMLMVYRTFLIYTKSCCIRIPFHIRNNSNVLDFILQKSIS